jgi:hypothetical protein
MPRISMLMLRKRGVMFLLLGMVSLSLAGCGEKVPKDKGFIPIIPARSYYER